MIQLVSLNILTDAVWAERASTMSFAGPKRVSAPAISLQVLLPLIW
jgi:L-ascorbate metabolism protein UlaG (beta-lactamase superfamily)